MIYATITGIVLILILGLYSCLRAASIADRKGDEMNRREHAEEAHREKEK